jgi:hypothetical protein
MDDINGKMIGMLRIVQSCLPHFPRDGSGPNHQYQRYRRHQCSRSGIDARL